MKIRDSLAVLKGNQEELEMPSGGLDILDEEGRTMFRLSLRGGTLSVDSGTVCKVDGKVLDNKFVIVPRAANLVELVKVEYESVKKLIHSRRKTRELGE